MRFVLTLSLFLGLTVAAHAQNCVNGLINGCPPAVSPQGSDMIMIWQNAQTPHIRSMTFSQMPLTGVATIVGGTINGAAIGTTTATNIGTLGTSGNVTIGNSSFGNTVFLYNPNLMAGDGSQLKITPLGGSPVTLATVLAPFGGMVANTILGNPTGLGAPATSISMPSCATGALTWTLGTGPGCNTGLAPLASPTFTGTPAAPTAGAGTNTTQLATTAFVSGVAKQGQFLGTATNDNATAGNIGEFPTTSDLTNVSLTTNTAANVSSVSLTAGDWEVSGCVYYSAASTTTWNQVVAGISTTSATIPTYPGPAITLLAVTFPTGPASSEICSPPVRESLASTTTVYLIARATFATSTMTANGYMHVRRVR